MAWEQWTASEENARAKTAGKVPAFQSSFLWYAAQAPTKKPILHERGTTPLYNKSNDSQKSETFLDSGVIQN